MIGAQPGAFLLPVPAVALVCIDAFFWLGWWSAQCSSPPWWWAGGRGWQLREVVVAGWIFCMCKISELCEFSCPTNISAFQVFLCPKANWHPWLIFGTTFKIYDIFGKVTQKSMGKWLNNLWGNATTSWVNDTELWGNDAKLWGNESKSMGKWLKIMGKWSKILWGIASTAKWLHPASSSPSRQS